ncbi:MAG: catD 2, partial [Rhodospirillales bacterium]|nr:catD 2 [Rhodospirillales bacterium]
MNHAEIQGERIAYREAGQGTPVLLIHSLGTSSEIWEPTIAQLADKFRVIAMDCRGHGGSTNRGGFSVEAIAEDAHALMTKLGAERFHYAGISMGGLYGIKGYALARERFLSLTLADSFAAPNPMGPARVAQTREILAQSSMLEFGKSYVADTLLPTTASSLHQRIAEIIGSMKAADYMQTLEAIMVADVTRHLPEIEIPTLIV